MKNMALELAPYGIRCNAISPGAVKTRLVPPLRSDDGPALRRLLRELERGLGVGGLAPYPAPATAACIDRLMLRDLLAAE